MINALPIKSPHQENGGNRSRTKELIAIAVAMQRLANMSQKPSPDFAFQR
jgi:hypothetical protein